MVPVTRASSMKIRLVLSERSAAVFGMDYKTETRILLNVSRIAAEAQDMMALAHGLHWT